MGVPGAGRAGGYRALRDTARTAPSNSIALATFFPAQRDLVKYGPSQWSRSAGEYCVRMERVSEGGSHPDRLTGVLVVPGLMSEVARPIEVDAPLTDSN